MSEMGWLDHKLNSPKDWLLNFKPMVTNNCTSLMETTEKTIIWVINPTLLPQTQMGLLLDTHITRNNVYNAKMKITSL